MSTPESRAKLGADMWLHQARTARMDMDGPLGYRDLEMYEEGLVALRDAINLELESLRGN